jgi:hypothetical protein
MNPADGGADVAIGFRGDRTRIQYDYFSISGAVCGGQSAIKQVTFDAGAIRLSSAAAEVLQVETGHAGVF